MITDGQVAAVQVPKCRDITPELALWCEQIIKDHAAAAKPPPVPSPTQPSAAADGSVTSLQDAKIKLQVCTC